MRSNALNASAAAGALAQFNQQPVGTLYGNYVYSTAATSYTSGTTYIPTSLGQTITISGYGTTSWNPQSYPPAAPYKGQVINWGGKVYYQPSDKMRALVDAMRLV